MKVLAFDCASSRCAVGVIAGDTVLASRAERMDRGHAELLLPMIESVLDEARLRLAALDLLAVTIGPGSFTGLRIGLAAARGLALATGLPCAGVTSFAAVAAAIGPERRAGRPLVVALESRRAELFVQCFAADGPALGAGFMALPEEAADAVPAGPLVVAGDAAARLAPALGGRAARLPAADLPEPADIARLALADWRPGERPPLPRPFYLRAPDTTLAAAATGLTR
jgi:tRNA threonylcarbamoyladenosine biosynthesis protein TsaB